MRPQSISQTGTGNSAWVPVDWRSNPMNLSFGAVVSGTVNYTIQHTFDNVFDSTVTPTAFNHEFVASATTSEDGNYAFPVRAIRISVASGSGTVTLTLLQPGSAA